MERIAQVVADDTDQVLFEFRSFLGIRFAFEHFSIQPCCLGQCALERDSCVVEGGGEIARMNLRLAGRRCLARSGRRTLFTSQQCADER
jgi:hypothetical protein